MCSVASKMTMSALATAMAKTGKHDTDGTLGDISFLSFYTEHTGSDSALVAFECCNQTYLEPILHVLWCMATLIVTVILHWKCLGIAVVSAQSCYCSKTAALCCAVHAYSVFFSDTPLNVLDVRDVIDVSYEGKCSRSYSCLI